MPTSASRRQHARAPFDGEVSLAEGGARQAARARDLSASGLGLELRGPHPRHGSEVETEFALPGMRLPVAVRSRVVWTNAEQSRLGLRFDAPDPDLGELIERFLAPSDS